MNQELNTFSEEFILYLQKNNGSLDLKNISEKFKKVNDEKLFNDTINHLYQLNYIYIFGLSYEKYTLTQKGRYFKSWADEDKKRNREIEKEELDFELKKFTKKTFITQQIVSWAALSVAIASVLIAWLKYNQENIK